MNVTGQDEVVYTWFTDSNNQDDMPMNSTSDTTVVDEAIPSFFAKDSKSNTLDCKDNDGVDYNINAVNVEYDHTVAAVGASDTITVTWYFDLKEAEFWAMVGQIWWECGGVLAIRGCTHFHNLACGVLQTMFQISRTARRAVLIHQVQQRNQRQLPPRLLSLPPHGHPPQNLQIRRRRIQVPVRPTCRQPVTSSSIWSAMKILVPTR